MKIPDRNIKQEHPKKFFVKKFEERFKEEVNAGKLVTDAIKDPQIWSIFKTDELEFDVSFVL